MDVDLEAPTDVDSDRGLVNGAGGGVSEEALIFKIGGKGNEGAAAHGEATENEFRRDEGVIGGGEDGVESGAGEKEVENSDVVHKKRSGVADDDDLDVDIGEPVVRDRAGDGGVEGVKSGVGEKEVGNSDGVDKKWSGVDLLEDVDVDIDDSGDVRTAVLAQCGHASFDVGGDEMGNGKGNMEHIVKANNLEKEDEMEFGGGGASLDNAGKMDQDDAVGEPVDRKSGTSLHPDGGIVGNLVGESEDEEVDIGGDQEPNLFTNSSITTDGNIRSEPEENVLHASYQLAAGKEGGFSMSDMVWGKVRSHPWWPGQIFDQSKASEVAMKHHKKEKECYLVTFFGDRTFAWSEASQLKHFHTHFPHVEKQSSSEALHHAISCALEEVSRRVELGLACHCMQTDVYEKLRYQNVENTGIEEESSRVESTGEFASAYLFEPHNFLHYIKSVARNPSNGADQLEIVIAKAQLLAFNRRKGYYHLPEYQFNELSFNNNSETVTDSSFPEEGHNQSDSSMKRKYNIKEDIVYTSKRERSMDESMLLMGEDYEDDENFHSSSASLLTGKRQNTGGPPKQSFKIGDCIIRAASQLTGSPGPSSFLKSMNEKYQKVSESSGAPRDVHAHHDHLNLTSSGTVADDMLLQPQSVAHDPTKELSANNIGNTSPSPDTAVDGRNTKPTKSIKGTPEAFEFEDMKDSYWTDRVIQNGGEEKPDRKFNYQVVNLQPPASFSRTPRVHSRKRYSNGNHKIAAERPVSAIEKSKQDMLPAELILNFPDMNLIPSEGRLNNMFRRFGPLKEFETEVDRESNRARVVFKRAYDADVAYNSCEKFNIFGSAVVRYELSYTPSVSYKAGRIPATQNMETDTLPEIDFASSAHDLEFITMQELEDATMQDLQYPHHHDLEGVTMQDLEFTTTHDLEFPGSQDLDIVSTHASEVTLIQSLDATAQDQHPATSEMPSSGHLEFQAGENKTDVSGTAPQDMEIATAEDQQQVNQDSSVKTPEDLESGKVQEFEAAKVQQVKIVMNPEIASEPTSVDTNGHVDMEISAQDAGNSLGQNTEVTVTEDFDVTAIGEEKIEDNDTVSGNQLTQDKGLHDNGTNSDVTRLPEPEVGTDDPMILGDQIAEQEANLENDTVAIHQSADRDTNRENDSMAIQESQVTSREGDPAEIEMQAPDVEKKQDLVHIDATDDLVPAAIKDATSETVGMTAGVSQTEGTQVAAHENKNKEDSEVPAGAIRNTGDDASVIAEDTELETAEQDEKQIAQDYANEAPDAEVILCVNVEIIATGGVEPKIEDSSLTGNVVAERVIKVQNGAADGRTSEEPDEKDFREQDFKKDEQEIVDSTTNEGLQEAA